jgi:hypothetical protein
MPAAAPHPILANGYHHCSLLSLSAGSCCCGWQRQRQWQHTHNTNKHTKNTTSQDIRSSSSSTRSHRGPSEPTSKAMSAVTRQSNACNSATCCKARKAVRGLHFTQRNKWVYGCYPMSLWLPCGWIGFAEPTNCNCETTEAVSLSPSHRGTDTGQISVQTATQYFAR